jgi:hypothetical protein
MNRLKRVLTAVSLGFALWIALGFSLYIPAPAAGQEPSEDTRATSFQAVQGAQKEDVPGGSLLVGAYAVVLVLIVGYVARLGMMHQKTASDVERLSRLLETQRKG